MKKAIAIMLDGYIEDMDTFKLVPAKRWFVLPTITEFHIEEAIYNPFLLIISHCDSTIKTVLIYKFKRDAKKVVDEIILALEEYYGVYEITATVNELL